MPELRLLLGADPELFLKNSKGELVSAHDILPGTKVEPFPVGMGAIQVDGVAAEFNITPAKSAIEFITNINTVMTHLKHHAKNMELVIEPTATFERSYFDNLPDSTRELGCNPDYNAWTGQVNPAPDGASTTMRTASGHIHLGWCEGVNPTSPLHFEDCMTVIKQLDYYLGIFSLLWDGDNTRRQLYGKAGAFRPKSYGCEYRTMSNVWLRSQKVQEWMFRSANKAIQDLLGSGQSCVDKFGSYAQEVIDGNQVDWINTKKGMQVISYVGLNLPDVRQCLRVQVDQPMDEFKLKSKVAKYKYVA